MKTIYKLIPTLIPVSLAVGLTGCGDENLSFPDKGNTEYPISISAAYPSQTRASDAGFTDGDRMGVYVLDYTDGTPEDISGDVHGKNVRFTFHAADNSWSGATDLYWTSNETPADIIGYYPFIADVSDPTAVGFCIERRQDTSGSANSPGGYEASDFLWGKAVKAFPTSERVNLTLRHVMAGVRVALKEGDGFGADEWNKIDKSVLISNIVPDATVSLATGEATPGSRPAVSVTPLAYNGEWRGIVIPQTVKAGQSVIAVTVDGINYNLAKSEDMVYTSGKLHTFTITVDKRTDTGKYEFKLTDEAVTPWLDTVEFRDGIMREYVIVKVPKRGTLAQCIAAAGYKAEDLINLKIEGELDENDFRYIRENLSYLKSLNLYESVVYEENTKDVLPDEALCDMSTLNHVVFPKKMWRIGSCAFADSGLMGDLIIPEGVTHLGKQADLTDATPGHWGGGRGVFTNCFSLVGNLSLPTTLEFIESATFCRAYLSGELVLPDNVKFIGSIAFDGSRFSGQLVLPKNLEELGQGAFYGVPLTGNLVIPQGIKVIREFTFSNGKYNLLELPEGLIEIQNAAFQNSEIKGELKLPSTLRGIESYAFSGNKFSSIIFPDEILQIGNGCFENNTRLGGSIKIPENITAINHSLFVGCTLLEEVIIGKNVTKIEGEAFGNCYNLTSVVINNPEPPMMTTYEWNWKEMDPFYNVPKDNFTLQVPAQSVEEYRRADGWKEFKRIAAYSNFVCRPAMANALTTRHQERLVLNSDGDWEVSHQPSWCSLSKTSGTGKTELTLTINELSKGAGNREDYIEFSLKGTEFTTRCSVSQFDYQYDEDECVTLQKASRGNGINVLFVGDGFDGKAISEGDYLNLVNEQMEAFFGLPPYSTYRDYFNVYACISLSQESGVNTAATWRNTRFMTLYTGGTLMHDNVDDVFDYAVVHSPLTKEGMNRSLIIMSLNSDEYGSATTMTWDGSAIAICSPSSESYPMDTRGIVQHEAGGHAFGKLAEERINYNRYLTSGERSAIDEKNMYGWWRNISTSGKMAEVPWSHFIFDPRYSDNVDVFEGGYGVSRGVFRSEINSCMNYGIPYYNAMSRQEIVRRILEYSGEGFTMERFYAEDSDKWGSIGSTRTAMPAASESYSASGLHHPVRIVKSKKY